MRTQKTDILIFLSESATLDVSDMLAGAAGYVWRHKAIVAAGMCIVSSLGTCAIATAAVWAGNEIDLVREGAPITSHQSNSAMAAFGLVPGFAGWRYAAGAKALEDTRYALPQLARWEQAMLQGTTGLGPAVCAASEVGGKPCP